MRLVTQPFEEEPGFNPAYTVQTPFQFVGSVGDAPTHGDWSTARFRSGTRGFRINNAHTSYIFCGNAFPATDGPLYCTFWLRIDTATNITQTFFGLGFTINDVKVGFRMNSDRTIQLYYVTTPTPVITNIGSPTTALTAGEWYCLGLLYDRTGGAGASIVRGYLWNGSFDEFAGASNLTIVQCSGLNWGKNHHAEGGISGTCDYTFDDIICNDSTTSFDNSMPNPLSKFQLLKPNGAGDNSQWTPSVGSNWQCVDEIPYDDPAGGDYVSTNTAGNIDDYNLEPFSGVGNEVINKVLIGWAHTGSMTGPKALGKLRYKSASGGTVAQSAALEFGNNTGFPSPDVGVNNKQDLSGGGYPDSTGRDLTVRTNPSNGAALTVADINSSQIGIELTTAGGSGSPQPRVTTIWAIVEYQDFVPVQVIPHSEWVLRRNRYNVVLLEQEVSIELKTWTLHSGSVYKTTYPDEDERFVVHKLKQDGTELSKGTDVADLTSNAGKFFQNLATRELYLRCSDSANPSGKTIEAFTMFFICNRAHPQLRKVIFNKNRYEQRLMAGMPRLSSRLGDYIYGTAIPNLSSVAWANGDKKFNKYFKKYRWEGRQGTFRQGDGGYELTYEEHVPIFTGRILNKEGDDRRIILHYENAMTAFRKKIPPKTFQFADYPNMDPKIEGKKIPELIGPHTKIPSYCIDVGQMKFKICKNALDSIDAVEIENQPKTFTPNLANGEYTLTQTVVTGVSAAPRSYGHMPSGTFYFKVTSIKVKETGDNRTEEETLASSEVSATVSNPTTDDVLVRWSRFPGTTRYRVYKGDSSNGQNKYKEVGAERLWLEWDADENAESGSPPSASTFNALPLVSCKRNVDINGTPGAALQLLGAAVKHLLKTYDDFKDSGLDLNSFADIDSKFPVPIKIYMGDERAVAEEIAQAEKTGIAFTKVNASGLVGFFPFDPTATPDVDFVDADFKSFKEFTENVKLFKEVKVGYDRNVAEGSYTYTSAFNPEVEKFYESLGTLTIDTFLINKSDADVLAQTILLLVTRYPERIKFDTFGKGFLLGLGRTISITRANGFTKTGSYAGETFFVMNVDVSPTGDGAAVIAQNFFGLGQNVGYWMEVSAPSWGSATPSQREQSGFWCDDNGLADASDPNSKDKSIWWR